MAANVRGPAIFLAQFAGDAAPFNTLENTTKWAGRFGVRCNRNAAFLCAAGIMLLCATGAARAETWVQVADSPIGGMESCVDTDSVRRGPDGKTEFRFAFCGILKGAKYSRIDCGQDLSAKIALDQQRKDGVFRPSLVEPTSPIGESALWVCQQRQD